MAYKAAEHGLVAAAREADGGDMVLAEGCKVVMVDDFVVAVVGEVWFEVGEAGEGVVDGFGWVVDQVEGLLCRGLFCLGFCCHGFGE